MLIEPSTVHLPASLVAHGAHASALQVAAGALQMCNIHVFGVTLRLKALDELTQKGCCHICACSVGRSASM